MQHIKITTTPIKYTLDVENARLEVQQPSIESNLEQTKKVISKDHVSRDNFVRTATAKVNEQTGYSKMINPQNFDQLVEKQSINEIKELKVFNHSSKNVPFVATKSNSVSWEASMEEQALRNVEFVPGKISMNIEQMPDITIEVIDESEK